MYKTCTGRAASSQLCALSNFQLTRKTLKKSFTVFEQETKFITDVLTLMKNYSSYVVLVQDKSDSNGTLMSFV